MAFRHGAACFNRSDGWNSWFQSEAELQPRGCTGASCTVPVPTLNPLYMNWAFASLALLPPGIVSAASMLVVGGGTGGRGRPSSRTKLCLERPPPTCPSVRRPARPSVPPSHPPARTRLHSCARASVLACVRASV